MPRRFLSMAFSCRRSAMLLVLVVALLLSILRVECVVESLALDHGCVAEAQVASAHGSPLHQGKADHCNWCHCSGLVCVAPDEFSGVVAPDVVVTVSAPHPRTFAVGMVCPPDVPPDQI